MAFALARLTTEKSAIFKVLGVTTQRALKGVKIVLSGEYGSILGSNALHSDEIRISSIINRKAGEEIDLAIELDKKRKRFTMPSVAYLLLTNTMSEDMAWRLALFLEGKHRGEKGVHTSEGHRELDHRIAEGERYRSFLSEQIRLLVRHPSWDDKKIKQHAIKNLVKTGMARRTIETSIVAAEKRLQEWMLRRESEEGQLAG